MTTRRPLSLGDAHGPELSELREAYRASGLSTLPADRVTTERVITGFYARIGKPAPRFLWFDGPWSCVLAINLINPHLTHHDLASARSDRRSLDDWPENRVVRWDPAIADQLTEFRYDLWGKLGCDLASELGHDFAEEFSWQLDSEDGLEWDRNMHGYGPYAEIRDELEIQVGRELQGQIGGQIRGARRPERSSSLGPVGPEFRSQVLRQLSSLQISIPPSFDWTARTESGLRSLRTESGFWGGEGQIWVGHYVACERTGAKFEPGARELLAEWDALQRACGWWFPFDSIVICAERHQVIHTDAASRLHDERGPAIHCRDGYKVYAWHGTRVPAEWIERRETLDLSTMLQLGNLEQRRIAVEIAGGWSKVLERAAQRVIDADGDPQIGTLFECDLPGAESSRFLRVRCATGREFVLSVPRQMTTAREANAWTYGLEGDDYQLEART